MVVAGIDVSKALWDVSVADGPVHRFENNGPGLRRLLQHMARAGGHTGGVRGHRRVVASRRGLPGPDVWLVAPPVRVFLCQVSRRVKSAQLARLTGTRWSIETCFQEGKQLLGATTKGADGRAGTATCPCACSSTSSCCAAGGRSKKAARPDPVPDGGAPGPPAGPRAMRPPGGTAALTSRCSVSRYHNQHRRRNHDI